MVNSFYDYNKITSLLMLSGQFYEKWASVRERKIKLLLETVTCIATTETVTCITTIEIVMCIIHCRKYYLHDCNRDSHLHSFSKNFHPQIYCRNFHLQKWCRNFQLHNCNRKSHLHNCNKKIHQHKCSKSSTNIIAIEPQKLCNCNSLFLAKFLVPPSDWIFGRGGGFPIMESSRLNFWEKF